MKATRKLIPAIAMLLVSVVMMSTASFAWFSMNTTVTATGMYVKATTSKNLVISDGSDGEYDVSTVLTDSNSTALTPVSVSCAKNDALSSKTWYKNTDGKGIGFSDGADDGTATFAVAENSGTEKYYETFTVYVKVEGVDTDTFDNLYVSKVDVTRGDTQPDVSKSLRVAVTGKNVAEDNSKTDATYIFAPLGGTYINGSSISALKTDNTATYTSQDPSTTGSSNASFGKITTQYAEFTVYVWYEGNDSNCNSEDAISTEELSISIKFAAE